MGRKGRRGGDGRGIKRGKKDVPCSLSLPFPLLLLLLLAPAPTPPPASTSLPSLPTTTTPVVSLSFAGARTVPREKPLYSPRLAACRRAADMAERLRAEAGASAAKEGVADEEEEEEEEEGGLAAA